MFKVSINYINEIKNYTFYNAKIALDVYSDACAKKTIIIGAKLGYVEEDGSEIEFMKYGKI